MKPLKADRPNTFITYVLDVESTGLGSPVVATSQLVRPPRPLLTVVRAPDGSKTRWWGERSIERSTIG
jgi:hypothetical protein